MLATATRYTDVRAAAQELQRAARRRRVRTGRRVEGLFLPTLDGSAKCLREWFWRELKEGGWLDTYLRRERARTPQAIRTAARLMDGFQQNNKSDLRRLAAVPAKLYHRWKAEDEHFWEDDANLRSLKRDNPDLPIYVGARAMPKTAERKTYPPASGERRAASAPPATCNLQPAT